MSAEDQAKSILRTAPTLSELIKARDRLEQEVRSMEGERVALVIDNCQAILAARTLALQAEQVVLDMKKSVKQLQGTLINYINNYCMSAIRGKASGARPLFKRQLLQDVIWRVVNGKQVSEGFRQAARSLHLVDTLEQIGPDRSDRVGGIWRNQAGHPVMVALKRPIGRLHQHCLHLTKQATR